MTKEKLMNEQACTCGADRTAPFEEAHDYNCPAKWLDRTPGERYPAPRANKQALHWPWTGIRDLSVQLKGCTDLTRNCWKRAFGDADKKFLGGTFEQALSKHGDVVTMYLVTTEQMRAMTNWIGLDNQKQIDRLEWCLAVAHCGWRAGLMRRMDLDDLERRIKEDANALEPL